MESIQTFIMGIVKLLETPDFRDTYMGFVSIFATCTLVLTLLFMAINRNFAKRYTTDVFGAATLVLYGTVSFMYVYDKIA